MTGAVAAIDFGTTYTTAAVRDETGVTMIALDHHDARLPSLVLRNRDPSGAGSWVVGWAASNQAALFPDAVERTPKRRLGVDEAMLLGGELLPVADAVGAVLRHAWTMITAQRQDVAEVVLTHPAAWPPRRRDLLVEAAKRAGISAPIGLCPEPVAAALAYSASNADSEELIAVYDLGGGTIDVAVLSGGARGLQLVTPPSGDPDLGGEDFDERVFVHLCGQLEADKAGSAEQLKTSAERDWRVAAEHLRVESRRAKEALSSSQRYSLYVPPPVGRDLSLHEHELRELISEDIDRSVDLLVSVIDAAAQATGRTVSRVYLVGGGSRIPAVQHTIEARTGLSCLTKENPKDVVARGATIWPDMVRASGSTALEAEPQAAQGGDSAVNAPVRVPSAATLGVSHALEPSSVTSTPDPPPMPTPASIALAADLAGRLFVVRPNGAQTIVSVLDGLDELRHVALSGEYAGAATGRSAALVVTRQGRTFVAHVLDPQLALRTTAALGTSVPRWVRAAGSRGWVIADIGRRDAASPAIGLPWGDTGRMNVWRVDLDAVMNAAIATPPLPTAFWRINEGDVSTLLDPSSPTTSPPDVYVDGEGAGHLTWVAGQFTSRRAFGLSRARPHADVTLSQLIITDVGGVQPVGEPLTQSPWTTQLAYLDGLRVTSGSAGITDVSGDVVVPRPQFGATRLVESSAGLLTVTVNRILEDAGVSVGRLDRTGHHVLWQGRQAPLRHVCAADRSVAAVEHNGHAVVAMRSGVDTAVLRIAPDGRVSEHGPFSGWCEPVSSGAEGLICLTAPVVPRRPSDLPPTHIALRVIEL